MLLRLRVVPGAALLVCVALGAGGCQVAAVSREPGNLTDAKAAVVAYHDSGAYAADVAAVARRAEAWMQARVARARPDERLAVVFDVDETVLSTFPHMRSQDFGYVPRVWSAYVAAGEAAALAPVRQVYRTARRLGVEVFFVTGRKDPPDRAGTELNLAREGLGEYAGLFMAAAGDSRSTAARKAAAREAIEQRGYRIIANLGDQHSDLAGGHAERTFKLPNPFYRVD